MTGLSGGEAMEKRLQHIADGLANGQRLRVGFLENAAYPDGTPVALVAGANEFGDPGRNRPPRPFLRHTVAEKSPDWPEALGKLLTASDYDAGRAFSLMGERIKSQIQASVRTFVDPPLAPFTVAAKSRGRIGEHPAGFGPEKPLIDTGHMLNSVDYDVQDGDA